MMAPSPAAAPMRMARPMAAPVPAYAPPPQPPMGYGAAPMAAPPPQAMGQRMGMLGASPYAGDGDVRQGFAGPGTTRMGRGDLRPFAMSGGPMAGPARGMVGVY